MLYATCSVFRRENQQQIDWFLQQHADAQLIDPVSYVSEYEAEQNLHIDKLGLQLLPLETFNDGFFYAVIEKK